MWKITVNIICEHFHCSAHLLRVTIGVVITIVSLEDEVITDEKLAERGALLVGKSGVLNSVSILKW